MWMSSTTALALPLKVVQSKNSSVKVGWTVMPLEYYENKFNGSSTVEFPFKAGTHLSKGCTKVDVRRSEINEQGGLRVTLRLAQVKWCILPRYSAILFFRNPSNPTTQITVDSKGQLAYYPIQGATYKISQVDGLPAPPPLNMGIQNDGDTTYFAVGSAAVEVEASNGDKAIANTGQMAIASPQGVRIVPIPSTEFRFEQFLGKSPHSPYNPGRVTFEQPNTATVDGRPIKSGQRVWPSVGGISIRGALD
jgi:hypothetical protein